MLLFEPPPTQGDIHFRLFGIPVRIHPYFWLGTIFLALGPNGTPPLEFVIWVAVVLVSILIHELGHAFTQRYFGGHPWITLHALGGLAACDDCDRRPSSQILISLAGPAAGFLFAAVVIAAIRLSGHAFGWSAPGGRLPLTEIIDDLAGIGIAGFWFVWQKFPSDAANDLIGDLLWVNIAWGLVNLLPVYPLDGGRVAREVCMLAGARRGLVASLQLSIVVAALMVVVALVRWHSYFTAVFFGYMAFANFQTLRAYRASTW